MVLDSDSPFSSAKSLFTYREQNPSLTASVGFVKIPSHISDESSTTIEYRGALKHADLLVSLNVNPCLSHRRND